MVSRFTVLLLLISCASCSTRRTLTVAEHVSDTTFVSVRDTAHIVLVRDTTIVNAREVITEHIINYYDPTSGMLTQQEVDRIIERTKDSLATRLIEQMTHLYDSIYSSSSQTDYHADDERAQGEASVSSWHILSRGLIALLMFFGFFILLIRFSK